MPLWFVLAVVAPFLDLLTLTTAACMFRMFQAELLKRLTLGPGCASFFLLTSYQGPRHSACLVLVLALRFHCFEKLLGEGSSHEVTSLVVVFMGLCLGRSSLFLLQDTVE